MAIQSSHTDEPNSNLDDQGEKELVEALRRIKSRSVPGLSPTAPWFFNVDKLLVMKEGAAIWSKDRVLASLMALAKIPKSATS